MKKADFFALTFFHCVYIHATFVAMKDQVIRIRADKDFTDKVDFLQDINGYKTKSDTIRKVVEKEYRKETYKGRQDT